jgi:inhibitor of KinA sporulation pathway (predicted exonuclease)
MLPCSEITQFPSVLVRLAGRASVVVDEFDTFVRPTFNPALSPFAMALTGITQADVDAAPALGDAMRRYMAWLRGHGLVDGAGAKVGSWAICTWTDADIGGQLSKEVAHKGLVLPPCFTNWVDLKQCFERHYKRPPRGGLQRCVEGLGIPFLGRAHNGLVDSQNTAAIVLHMAVGCPEHGAFTFRRTTVRAPLPWPCLDETRRIDHRTVVVPCSPLHSEASMQMGSCTACAGQVRSERALATTTVAADPLGQGSGAARAVVIARNRLRLRL